MKKRVIFTFLFVFYFLLCLHLVSANFVCGSVSSNEINPSWQTVKIGYSSNPQKITTCSVSPDGFKYCCDPTEIKEVSWGIGKEVFAYIFNLELNSYAKKTNLIITGQGYDLFNQLELKKVINVNSPSEKVLFDNSSVLLNVSVLEEFNNVSLYLENETGNILYNLSCQNCTLLFDNLGVLKKGNYFLKIFAYSKDGLNVSNTRNFSVFSDISISRSFICDRCTDDYVYAKGQNTTIVLNLNSSFVLNGILYDYFPNDWILVNANGGNFQTYSLTHNIIYWNVTGKNINISYTVVPPKTVLPLKYYFQSGYNNYKSDWKEVFLYRLFRVSWFSNDNEYNLTDNLNSQNIDFAYKNNPIVIYPNDSLIETFAIFLKRDKSDVVIRYGDDGSKIFPNSKFEYNIYINLNSNEIKDLLVRFYIQKNQIKNISNLSVLRFSNKDYFDKLYYNYSDSGEKYLVEFHSTDQGRFGIIYE